MESLLLALKAEIVAEVRLAAEDAGRGGSDNSVISAFVDDNPEDASVLAGSALSEVVSSSLSDESVNEPLVVVMFSSVDCSVKLELGSERVSEAEMVDSEAPVPVVDKASVVVATAEESSAFVVNVEAAVSAVSATGSSVWLSDSVREDESVVETLAARFDERSVVETDSSGSEDKIESLLRVVTSEGSAMNVVLASDVKLSTAVVSLSSVEVVVERLAAVSCSVEVAVLSSVESETPMAESVVETSETSSLLSSTVEVCDVTASCVVSVSDMMRSNVLDVTG